MATVARKSRRRQVGIVISNADEHAAPSITVPVTACDHAGFRAWATSDDFPQRGRISFLDQAILIDMSPEELETHNKVKTEVSCKIHLLGRELDNGEFYSDGTLATNKQARLSTEPDGTFVTWESIRTKRVRLVKRKKRPAEHIELVGSPDWMLEIIISSSWKKDTEMLPELYARAKVGEYWLIDALQPDVDFQILLLQSGAYVPAPNRDGWWDSPLFGRSFRLTRRTNAVGLWHYVLESK